MSTEVITSKPMPIPEIRMYKPALAITPLRSLTCHYCLCAPHEITGGIDSNQGIKSVVIRNGTLFIDDIHIVRPRFADDFISWKQITNSHYTSGHLHFGPGGLMLHGMIAMGKSIADAVTHQVVGSCFPLITHSEASNLHFDQALHTFSTLVTKERYPTDQDPDRLPAEAWTAGPPLGLGYDPLKGKHVVSLDNGKDIKLESVYKPGVNAHQARLEIIAIKAADISGPIHSDYYFSAAITISLNSLHRFSGSMTSRFSEPAGDKSGVYFWKGSTHSHVLMAAPMPNLFTRANLLQESALTLDELASLVPGSGTSKNDVNTIATGMLIENMKWAIAQRPDEKEWLNAFYGEKPPALSADRIKLINKSLSWYQDTYAKAQLGWQVSNFSGANKPKTQLTYYQSLKLKYFLQTGLAKDVNFNIQQQGLFPEAYAEALPRIKAYLTDGGEKWASQLLNDLYLKNLMIDVGYVQSTQDMSSVNQKCTLLTVLQPSGVLAKEYYRKFITATLQANIDKVSFTDQANLMQWLPQWLQVFLNQASLDPSKIPDSGKLAVQQLNDLLGQMGGSMTHVAQEMSLILASAPGSSIWSACQGAEEAWVTKYPKASAIGRLFFFAAFSYGLSSVIQAFGNWKNLSAEDKGKLVTATVALGVEALQIVPEMLISAKDMGTDIIMKINAWRFSSSTQEGIDGIGKQIDVNYMEEGMKDTAKLFNGETKVIEAEGTLWERCFGGIMKPVLKVFGVVVAAAFAAFSVYDFIRDIQSGQPISIIVMDGLIAALNIAVVICLVVEVVLMSTVASVLGVMFALIGGLISLIEMCFIKPSDPLDDFMKKVIIPFVIALPDQITPPAHSDTSKNLVVVFT